ncbi:PREDICTED: cytosolic carboxypeptidase 4-like isoform X2 [Priapulus caudatus]|nr:PREDICTED: cytosolic carboxypeptidase 4-like isoform X2 [Priapulus caudatus]
MLCVKPRIGGAVSKVSLRSASRCLLKVLVYLVNELEPIKIELLSTMYVIITKLSVVDKKLPVKARLQGALPVTVKVMLLPSVNVKLLLPLVKVLRIFAASSVNVAELGRSGAVVALVQLIQGMGRKHPTLQQISLEVLMMLLKSKKNLRRAVAAGIPKALLDFFLDWQGQDSRSKHIKEQNCLLTMLKQFSVNKPGRRALVEAGVVPRLYAACQRMSAARAELMPTASVVLRKCLPCNRLPLHGTETSIYTFSLPVIEHDPDCCCYATGEDVDEESSKQSQGLLAQPDLTVDVAQTCRLSCDMLDSSSTEEFFPELHDFPSVTLVTDISGLCGQVKGASLNGSSGAHSESAFVANAAEATAGCDATGAATAGSCGSNNVQDGKEDQGSSAEPGSTEGWCRELPAPSADYCDEALRSYHSAYLACASRTASVGRWNTVPYPDLCPVWTAPIQYEHLSQNTDDVKRRKLLEDISRTVHPASVMDKLVYSLDDVAEHTASARRSNSLTNTDEFQTDGEYPPSADHLLFNSQFESGNLRMAIQVRPYEYDLVLGSDINSNRHLQWFYFSVSQMEAAAPYRFNIVNCEKSNSQFNFGMQPVLFSVREAALSRVGWVRAGTDICYYKNHFTHMPTSGSGCQTKLHYTATFTLTFPHPGDVCYVAYHYPYTYSLLQTHLQQWEAVASRADVYFRRQVLCRTLAGNDTHVVTITESSQEICPADSRKYVMLSGRVHPGESNASWMMKGTIDYLLSPQAAPIRQMYIFKIVPMLNPDGVINGNHRCSLTGEDLNRKWSNPCPVLHPTVYHTKQLARFMVASGKPPLVFCDYHGHSRKKNVFLFGCSGRDSWRDEDAINCADDKSYLSLPVLLHQRAPSFNLGDCSFSIEDNKETTARVVMWREMGISRSYTMESTYCGCDQGLYQGYHVGVRELEEMGAKLCEVLEQLPHALGTNDHLLSKTLNILDSEDTLSEEDGASGDELSSVGSDVTERTADMDRQEASTSTQ